MITSERKGIIEKWLLYFLSDMISYPNESVIFALVIKVTYI